MDQGNIKLRPPVPSSPYSRFGTNLRLNIQGSNLVDGFSLHSPGPGGAKSGSIPFKKWQSETRRTEGSGMRQKELPGPAEIETISSYRSKKNVADIYQKTLEQTKMLLGEVQRRREAEERQDLAR